MRTILAMALAVAVSAAAQTPKLDFLSNEVDGRALREMLPAYLKGEVRRHRTATPAAKEEFRARFIQGLGGLPERTPLQARVVGSLERQGYRIEKVIFESQPGFSVTANLYLPASGSGPFPAILFPLGHETGGKAYPVWQQIMGTFARRGYVVLTWDPLGQGERIQHWDEAITGSRMGPSTTEHTVLGIQCLLTGDALARYTIWDGMRALDYLLSRPEVDGQRVGITGNSGGGTHTAYLAALDDRLRVAAPSCFLTSWQRLLDTIGPQDAEQCIPGFLEAGFEHIDFVRAFSPRPYLILSAIRDFFSIQGARSTYAEAREFYPERDRISMAEANEGHGYTPALRLASYQWFDKWLKGRPSPAGEDPVAPATFKELSCTASGQVASSLHGETVFTLNRVRARALNTPSTVSRDAFRRHIRWREDNAPPVAHHYGEERSCELKVEMTLYESEAGIVVPAVVVEKPGAGGPRPGVLLVSDRGKAQAWPEIRALAERGAVVMAIDARGFGETRPSGMTKGDSWNYWFGDFNSAMTSVLLGSSMVSQRAQDIQRGFYLLASRSGVDRARIYGAGHGHGAVALLHAAAAGVPFERLLLDGMLVSYRAVVEAPVNRDVFESVVSGALRVYDFPGLAGLAAAKAVTIVDAVSPMGMVLDTATAQSEYRAVPSAGILARAIEEPAAAVYARLID
jgi:cephalosporin-C deacetylase-like acetyl esterase